jgi:hypothetical protein
MATGTLPGEQAGQLAALLERWQTSLDLHARYAALDDARYWHVQPWPKHERPQRWIIQLARKRILALQRLVAQRQTEGDRACIEAIETMGFLATLVGLTSAERIIPLATRENERREVLAANMEDAEEPREDSRPPATRVTLPSRPAAVPRPAPANLPIAGRAQASATAAKRRETARPAAGKPKKPATTVTQMEHVVIADAVRLLGWGRQWHELAEMIERLAERPSPSEIRRILRTYREHIDAVVRRRGQ